MRTREQLTELRNKMIRRVVLLDSSLRIQSSNSKNKLAIQIEMYSVIFKTTEYQFIYEEKEDEGYVRYNVLNNENDEFIFDYPIDDKKVMEYFDRYINNILELLEK